MAHKLTYEELLLQKEALARELNNSADLIERQRAEIDKLTCDYGCYKVSATDIVEHQKAEIKRLEDSIKEADNYFSEGDFAKGLTIIINLAKEFAEGKTNV